MELKLQDLSKYYRMKCAVDNVSLSLVPGVYGLLGANGTGLYNLTLFLLPYRSTMPETGKYISYQIGGLVLDALSVRAILYGALTVITLPVARMCFKKHQVSA